MNWSLFIYLCDLLFETIWFIYCFVRIFITTAFIAEKKQFAWKLISIYRFIRPVRLVLCGWLILSYALEQNGFLRWFGPLAILMYLFLDRDDFGDDPRDKKKSKILEKIKMIGHRLVVVPNTH